MDCRGFHDRDTGDDIWSWRDALTLLDIVIFLPGLSFITLLMMKRHAVEATKWTALILSLINFVLSLGLIAPVLANPAGWSFVNDVQWIAYPNIRYHVGIDGVSLWLVVLATFLTPIAILISWHHIETHHREFYAFLVLLASGLIGVFCSLDLFLFYVFWEVALVPMYFLIGVWGHERRIYAALKFFVYTMAGSVLMLAGIIYLYNKTGTFDYTILVQLLNTGQLILTPTEENWLFLAFFVAFAIKVPLFPLHTWLPHAHVEAPTAGSVDLAALMLKMGTYGILRFCLPMFPNASREHAWWIITLAIFGIIYGALVALVQPNIKKLVAYSSVSHLGFVVLGLFSFTQMGLDGAVYLMLAHGLSTGALFMYVGMMYERRESLSIRDYGGVASAAPWLATFFMIATLASIGLPTLSNFPGEFLVLIGAAQVNFPWAVFAATGVIFSACYMLWVYQRTFYGRVPTHQASHEPVVLHPSEAIDPKDPDTIAQEHPYHTHEHAGFYMPDMNRREWVAAVPMTVMMIWMGVGAQSFLPSISASNTQTLNLHRGTMAEVADAR
jgi:NADH-quinone oxidoreductase subunit M